MCLIAMAIRISRAKCHCNRLTTVQDIQDYSSLSFLGHSVHATWHDSVVGLEKITWPTVAAHLSVLKQRGSLMVKGVCFRGCSYCHWPSFHWWCLLYLDRCDWWCCCKMTYNVMSGTLNPTIPIPVIQVHGRCVKYLFQHNADKILL